MTTETLHIILVEDDTNLRYAFMKLLETAGYSVHSFPDYRGVLEMLDRGERADLLVVDIALPEGTPHGVAVAGMERRRLVNLPVVFVTAYPEFADYVPENTKVLLKPVTGDALLEAVAEFLAR